jgi:hypothetical protein
LNKKGLLFLEPGADLFVKTTSQIILGDTGGIRRHQRRNACFHALKSADLC